MKRPYLLLVALVLAACEPNKDNNKSFDYDMLDVNFSIRTAGFEMPANSVYGIGAYRARGDQDAVQMNAAKKASQYKSLAEGESSGLIKASDADVITAYKTDHSFSFYAAYPYSADTDFTAVAAAVPATQAYADGVQSYVTFTAYTKVTSVIPTAELVASTPFALLNLSVPIDIVNEGTPATLKSIVITPVVAANFSGALAGQGTVNAETGVFTLSTHNRSTSITITFPDEGLALQTSTTVIPVLVLPFTVPEGGFSIEFTDANGEVNKTAFLTQESDTGTGIVAGSATSVAITHYGDGIVPVSFPVEWPIGREGGDTSGTQRFTDVLFPEWKAASTWHCSQQRQAYATWNKVSDPSTLYTQWIETVNSGVISTPGVKGIWTGDYWEFVVPVRKIQAGSTIIMKFPFYGRFQPVFWNIRYLDGEDWKIFDYTDKICYDGTTSAQCTFSLPHDKIQICNFEIILEKAVKSGYLRFRLECADGSIQANTGGVVSSGKTYPYVDNTNAYSAPCYFRTEAGGALHEISISLIEPANPSVNVGGSTSGEDPLIDPLENWEDWTE